MKKYFFQRLVIHAFFLAKAGNCFPLKLQRLPSISPVLIMMQGSAFKSEPVAIAVAYGEASSG